MSSGIIARTATHELWSRLRQPFDFAEAVSAVFGIQWQQANTLEMLLLSASPEAATLINDMPQITRSLAAISTPKTVRCYGEIRGPILWGETFAAWGASGAQEDVMICAVPVRGYDCDENQLLKVSLQQIARTTDEVVDALLLANPVAAQILDKALGNAERAQQYLQDPRLLALRPRRIWKRDIQRIRLGPFGRLYRPASLLHERKVRGADVASVVQVLGEDSLENHQGLIKLVEELEGRGSVVRPFRAREATLASGNIEFRHPALWAERDWSGIRYDSAPLES